MKNFDRDPRAFVGRIQAIQSFGTVDGPGVRFVIFLQGCPLRCSCCHNPETWDVHAGSEVTVGELFEKILRYRHYFGKEGGVTVSGGEPLLQAEFVRALFSLCRQDGIHTCLDTSGCVLPQTLEDLLSVTDLVLLDIKYSTEEKYRLHVGCSMETPLRFLEFLNKKHIATWIRQVIVRGVNDTETEILLLKEILQNYTCIQKTELLPFRRLCREKYQELGIDFPFAEIPDTTEKEILALQKLL